MQYSISSQFTVFAVLAGLSVAGHAQVPLDRADPTIIERALPRTAPVDAQVPKPVVEAVPRDGAGPRIAPVRPNAIVVTGTNLPPETFSSVIVAYVGRDLGRDDLARLAGDIAASARRGGYPFANASIQSQSMAEGTLRVSLDDGRIDAVRVVGAVNSYADRILTRALVTGRPARQADLARAILLVGDIPGMVVKESRLVRQNGFSILLVTATLDRASAYVQFDNRGSREVGPIRSTTLASLRTVLRPGDEVALLLAQTPADPSEFAFVRGRYSTPVGADGTMLSIAGSYGRSHPGGSLTKLDVIGHSADAGLILSVPLVRDPGTNVVAGVELRHLRVDQGLAGTALRLDRIDTLTGTVDVAMKIGGGDMRGQASLVWGLPIAGVSHQGDRLISRADGDARFVTIGYYIGWTRELSKALSLVLASSGQKASRPLLATFEIGAGGPGFGRAYDYSERTGDDGLLGSAELRASFGPAGHIIDRTQLFAVLDGGVVGNLNDGKGGGGLVSTGAGARIGVGRFDATVEVAFPLNADRFDTDNRDPRVSFKLSRLF